MALRPTCLLPPKRLSTPRSARHLTTTNRGLLPGSPTTTRTGLPPAGFVQLPGRNMFDDPMVMVETYSAELTSTQPREFALYAKAFALLHCAAVYGSPTHDLITKALTDFS